MKTAEDYLKTHASFEFDLWKKDCPGGYRLLINAIDHGLKDLREQLKQERNKAIDDCIDAFLDKSTEEGYFKKRNFSHQECKSLLKSLKTPE